MTVAAAWLSLAPHALAGDEPPPPDAPAADAAAPATEPPPASAHELDVQLYGGIVVSGVAAALFVVAGMAVSRISALEDDPGFVAYRAGFTPDRDVCSEALAGARVDGAASPERVVALCDEASRWEITNYVAVPGGVALLGMGLYLILTSDTASVPPPVAVAPQLGPSLAGLTVSGRF